MIETDPLTREAAKICELMDVEVKLHSGIWSFKKKRNVSLKNNQSSRRHSLNVKVSFYGTQEGEPAVNMAEVHLLTEEVQVFTTALRQDALLFPTNYLQQLTMEQGKCRLLIESLEPVEHFVERLCVAFGILKKQMPTVSPDFIYAQ